MEVVCLVRDEVLIKLQESFQLQQIKDGGDFQRLQTADVTLIDLSALEWKEEMCVFFHLGAREKLGQSGNVLLTSSKEMGEKFSFFKGSCKVLYYEPSVEGSREPGADELFFNELKDAIVEAFERSGANKDGEDAQPSADFSSTLGSKAENELIGTLSTLRESENYENIIKLVETNMDFQDVIQNPEITYFYTFALTRIRSKESRDKALEIILCFDEKNNSGQTSPDLLCLAGRIYKDRFQEGPEENQQSLEEAIRWYRRAFEAKPGLFAGINLLTLLIIKGEDFQTNPELREIGIQLSYWLGKKHGPEAFTSYWDSATWLELNLLMENVPEVVSAAEGIRQNPPKPWCLRSTLKNIDLILHFRKDKMKLDSESQSALYASVRTLKECAQG